MQNINTLPSKHKDNNLYVYKDSLFVWNSKTFSLYGLRTSSAALFLFMDENKDKHKIYKFIKDSGAELTDEMYKLIDKISGLIDGKLKTQSSISDLPEFSLSGVTIDKTKGFFCNINGWDFFLGVERESILNVILPSFEHLISNSSITKLPLIDVSFKNNIYEISINHTKVKEVSSLKHIVPVLQDIARLIYYQSTEYLIAIHSASLEYKRKVLLLPGVSGSGKSTLCSYLMYNGFKLFSDELTVIKPNGYLLPIPLALSIKEGSWKIVGKYVSKLESLCIHHRFDEQNIRILPPKDMAEDNVSIENGCIVFPKYIKNAQVDIAEIDIIEAMQLITEAQYQIKDTTNYNHIELWLGMLSKCKIYKLYYGTLLDAKEAIDKVMKP